jgi:octanoyl-[GcvH]:protein N-octanoyltransferase
MLEADPKAPPPPVFRVWSNVQCLVATRREERLDGFEAALRTSEARGWPVVLRDSGGTVVPHLAGSLHLTLLLPRREAGEPGTDQVYRMLCEPVRETLASLGLDADYGQVPRSFCDGRYNLVHEGRKLAGTAQRWRGGIPGHPVRPGVIVSHLTLWVEGDMAEATLSVNRFLDEAGAEGDFDPAAATTVRQAAGVEKEPRASEGGWLEATRQALLAELRQE